MRWRSEVSRFAPDRLEEFDELIPEALNNPAPVQKRPNSEDGARAASSSTRWRPSPPNPPTPLRRAVAARRFRFRVAGHSPSDAPRPPAVVAGASSAMAVTSLAAAVVPAARAASIDPVQTLRSE